MKRRSRARSRTSTESDERLVELVRDGHPLAYDDLYRRYRGPAVATARHLVGSSDVDDVVADAFTATLAAIRRGNGPRDDFRRYLLACVRNGSRSRRRVVPVSPEDGCFEQPGPGAPAVLLEDPERYVEADTVARAFAALPPRWQQMLWSTAVEQRSSNEAGALMALAPNAAAQLARRAREAFAIAYLAEHVEHHGRVECGRFLDQLPAYVRGQLTPARAAAVQAHVDGCPACATAVADLRDVNASLRTLLPAPLAAVAGGRAAVELAVTGALTRGVIAGLPSLGGIGLPSAGWPFVGLLTKVLAGVALVAPVAVTGVAVFDGQASEPATEPAVVEVAPAAVASSEPSRSSVASTTPTSSTVVVSVADVRAAPRVVRPTEVAPPAPTPTVVVAEAAPTVPADLLEMGETVADVGDVLGRFGAAPLLDAIERGDVIDGVDTLLTGTSTGVVEAVAEVAGMVLPAVTDATSDIGGLAATLVTPTVSVPPLNLPSIYVPSISVPSISVPSVSVPAVSVPSIGVPSLTVPVVTVPPVTVPAVSLPALTVPAVTVPLVNLPLVTVPPVTVPVVTVPLVTLPPVTAPPATVPSVMVPPVTVAVVTVPLVTLPPVTAPPATVPPVTVPPLTVPPVTTPAVTVPPVTVPPVTVPPVTAPPATVPPVTVPPVTVPTITVTTPPPGVPVTTIAVVPTVPTVPLGLPSG